MVAVTILILITAVLVFYPSLFHVYPIGSHVNNSNNTTPTIPYKTYADNRITFKYPADWKPIKDLHSPTRWGYPPDPIVAFYDPSDNHTEANISTYFYVKQLNFRSFDEELSKYRHDIANIGQTEVSERNITVNGMKAVELIKTWHADGIQYQALTVHIEAVPGSKYYRIGCVTPLSKYNETLPKFRLVIESFKLL
ncbi:MAG TPA: PsbP-related protein [Methanothermobacter sp.]|nr:PsbP-related protein [Methanothermobacter sp.]HPU36933.1 PsbP-related protein [Methanothermobacter sp.]